MNEEILSGLIKATILPDAQKNGEFDPSDLSSVQRNMELELKSITKHYGRVMIERKKYDELMSLTCTHRRYICSTDRGVYSWDLNKIIIPDEWWQPVTITRHSTYFHREMDGASDKVCAKLPIGWSKIITDRIGWTRDL